jgi:hypothetical protein
MRSLCGVTRRDRLRNVDMRTQLGEITIVEEIDQYQKKWERTCTQDATSKISTASVIL